MIFTDKRLFFKTAEAYFSSADELGELLSSLSSFSKIVIYTHSKLRVPKEIEFKGSKPTPIIWVTNRNQDEVLASFRESHRKEIRKTTRDERFRFSVRSGADGEVYRMYARFERAQTRTPFPYRYFKKSMVFCAELEGRLIACLACLDTKHLVRVVSPFSLRMETEDHATYQAIGQASKRLVFEACVYAIEQGLKGVDLTYVNFEDPRKKGVTDFKMGFKGELVEEYRYEYVGKFARLLRSFSKYGKIFKKY